MLFLPNNVGIFQDNNVGNLRHGSRFFPVSQDGAQPSEIHNSSGVIPVSSATLKRPLPVDTQIQETISGTMENSSTDLDHMFADLRLIAENSEVSFPTLKRELLPPPCYREVMQHAADVVKILNTDLGHRFSDLRRNGENSGALFRTHKRESPPPPSYQEVMEGGYVELPQTFQHSTTRGTVWS